jgi:sulfate adenylyltransferase large subunit
MSLLGEIERRQVVADDDGVLRLVTAGSVDDGKSTLIGRLLHDCQAILEDQLAAVARASQRRGEDVLDLSLLTDGLEAEREQGITIDVAYRYFATPRRKFILADAPGHEQYTRNMVTGASTADAAVILVDARKGVLPQTRRHAYLVHLLGVRHVLIAVNKMDLVGYDRARFERICGDFRRFAGPMAIPDLRFIPVSALRGDMVVRRAARLPWYEGPTLLEALESAPVQDEAEAAPFRFPVQLVIRGEPRSYAGRVASGRVRAGDEVLCLPAGRRTRVREIGALDGSRDAAVAGDSVRLALADEIDLARGDVLADPEWPPPLRKAVHATLCWLDDAPLRIDARYLVKHGTRTVPARVAGVDHRIDIHTLSPVAADAALTTNEIGRVRLALQQPVPVDTYAVDRATGAFILIDPATHRTVAAGMVR